MGRAAMKSHFPDVSNDLLTSIHWNVLVLNLLDPVIHPFIPTFPDYFLIFALKRLSSIMETILRAIFKDNLTNRAPLVT